MLIITKIIVPNMISIGLKAQKLLRYHFSYHSNKGLMPMPIVLKKLYTKYGLNRT